MSESSLTDSFGRVHDYLRISLTELCNLDCSYCMPPQGLPKQTPGTLSTNEVIDIARVFIQMGVNKIRFTGGEPLLRKDLPRILSALSAFPVELAITTNGVLLNRSLPALIDAGVKKINVSLDSLKPERYKRVTGHDHFHQVFNNILLLLSHNIFPRINVVLMRGENCDEINDFIELTRLYPLQVRFIEFMPFDGNGWTKDKVMPASMVFAEAICKYGSRNIIFVGRNENETSRNFRIKGYAGEWGIISSVTTPFCEDCNRLRLLATGKLRNCLFAREETDILSVLRAGGDVEAGIRENLALKKKVRGGCEEIQTLSSEAPSTVSCSMIQIGG